MMRRGFAALSVLVAAIAIACDDTPEPDVPGSTTPQVASEVVGLFREPAPTTVARTAQLAAKPAPIAEWDGVSMVLFDVEAGTARDLGRGTVGTFSPDGTKVTWTRDPQGDFGYGEVILLDIATGEETPLGPGRTSGFVDDKTVAFRAVEAPNATTLVNIETGEYSLSGDVPIGEPFDRQTTPDGYVLRQEYTSENPFPTSIFHLERADGEELFSFEAYRAMPAGRGYLAVATVPFETGPPDVGGYAPQSTNIFLVHIPSGLATFVATSPAYGPNWPIIADERYVMWTENYCAPTPGRTRIFDRGTGEITETDATFWLQEFTPDGLIAAGAFGADELIEPLRLEYVTVIPASEARWSADYRYASVGQVGGHGGLCP